MFITPLLAIAGYYLADRTLAEPPAAMEPGRSYPLIARSNCRYQSGFCTLVNGDVKLTVTSRRLDGNRFLLTLASEQPLERALIALNGAIGAETPKSMTQNGNVWKNELIITDPATTQLRMAFGLNGAHFYAETSAIFVDYATGFTRDNFPEEM